MVSQAPLQVVAHTRTHCFCARFLHTDCTLTCSSSFGLQLVEVPALLMKADNAFICKILAHAIHVSDQVGAAVLSSLRQGRTGKRR